MVSDTDLIAAAHLMRKIASQVADGEVTGDAERITQYIIADAAILLIDLAYGGGADDHAMSANRFAGCVARTVLGGA